VVLSIILPTVIFPLVFLCSKDEVMTVEGPIVDGSDPRAASGATTLPPTSGDIAGTAEPGVPVQTVLTRTKSYKSPKWITILGYLLFSVVVVANAYVIVELALGNA
jgi:metal iron transporter